MRTESTMQRLASVLLQEPVLPWVQQRRDAGKPWRVIAEDLRTMTKGQVDVPHQTIVKWMDRAAQADQVAAS